MVARNAQRARRTAEHERMPLVDLCMGAPGHARCARVGRADDAAGVVRRHAQRRRRTRDAVDLQLVAEGGCLLKSDRRCEPERAERCRARRRRQRRRDHQRGGNCQHAKTRNRRCRASPKREQPRVLMPRPSTHPDLDHFRVGRNGSREGAIGSSDAPTTQVRSGLFSMGCPPSTFRLLPAGSAAARRCRSSRRRRFAS